MSRDSRGEPPRYSDIFTPGPPGHTTPVKRKPPTFQDNPGPRQGSRDLNQRTKSDPKREPERRGGNKDVIRRRKPDPKPEPERRGGNKDVIRRQKPDPKPEPERRGGNKDVIRRQKPDPKSEPEKRGGSIDLNQRKSGPKFGPQRGGWCAPKGPMETVNVELEIYDVGTQRWGKEKSILHHSATAFASGGMRNAFRAWNCKVPDWESHPMVLKMPILDELQNERLVRTQVVMQAKCVSYAKQFNAERKISKKISYVPCCLVKFLSGRWQGKFGCLEDYMEGHFVKHNTVNPDYDGVAMTTRNTPQAFSHYTFEKSSKTEIVVDVQGVGDTYTDPQLYSVSISGPAPPYGPADWAIMGVANFFKNHQCNDICLALGLIPNQLKTGSNPLDTLPTGGRPPGTRPKHV